MNRAALGGHSASERKLRDSYEHSAKNLVTAFEENQHQRIDLLRIFDNSERFGRPRMVLNMFRGAVRKIAKEVPVWLETVLAPSNFNIGNLRRAIRDKELDE